MILSEFFNKFLITSSLLGTHMCIVLNILYFCVQSQRTYVQPPQGSFYVSLMQIRRIVFRSDTS